MSECGALVEPILSGKGWCRLPKGHTGTHSGDAAQAEQERKR